MKKLLLAILAAISIFSSFTCDSTEPTDGRTISLEAVDASCTEAWLNVALQNVPLPAKTILTRNDSLVGELDLFSADTVIIDEGLNPSTDYSFKLSLADGSINSASSIRTMDTTSHNFIWQTFSFGGQGGSSMLYDVAIIDENNIWGVGEIYTADDKYNAVHWDGSVWELKKIEINSITYPLRNIFAFSKDNILFSNLSILHWNGTAFNIIKIPKEIYFGQQNGIWGISSSNFYVVGNGGNIAHYDGSSWTKVESGTDLHIYDIWGDYNDSKDSYEITTIAAEHLTGPGRKILAIENNSVSELSTSNISLGSLHGIWFKSGRKYFVVGNGIYAKNNISSMDNWDASLGDLTSYYSYVIRGSALNNIFICGSFGESLHFNGMRWKSFRDTPGFYDAEFLNTDITGQTIVSVGYRGSRGFIAVGKR